MNQLRLRNQLLSFVLLLVFILLVNVSVTLFSKPIVVQARGTMDEKLPYFVGFHTIPTQQHIDLVNSVNGDIDFVYHRIPVIEANLTSVSVDTLLGHILVAYVETNCKCRLLGTSDYRTQTLSETLPWGVERIDADVVHGYPERGSGVKVAVLDSGVDYTHEDLASNYKGGWDFINNDNDPMDDYFNSHGTMVAGVIAAAYNNKGVRGVAPEVDLYVVKVFPGGTTVESRYGFVNRGLQWSVDNGMDIVCLCLGGPWYQESFEKACQDAYDSGVLLVAAAGDINQFPDAGVCYPGKFESVIAVSATDSSDELESSSPSGSEIELAAPGWNIPSTARNNQYPTMSGTSMAAPHVAGTAVLILGCRPSLTNEQVRQRLQDTAENLPNLGPNEEGYGLVDAEAAVTQDRSVLSVTPSTQTLTCGGLTIDVKVKNEAKFTDSFSVTTYYDANIISTKSVTVASGATKTLTFSWWPTKIGTYKIKAKAATGNCEPDTSDNTKEDGWVAVVGTGPCVGVGGIMIPTDKLGLLAPYIGVASTILVATVATAIYAKRVKRKKRARF